MLLQKAYFSTPAYLTPILQPLPCCVLPTPTFNYYNDFKLVLVLNMHEIFATGG